MIVVQRKWRGADGTPRVAWTTDFASPLDGRRVRRKLDVGSEREAQAAAACVLADLQRRAVLRAAGVDVATPEQEAVRLSDLFARDVRRPGVSDHTRRMERQKHARLLRDLGDVPVHKLDARRLNDWARARLEGGWKGRTANMHLVTLAAALNRAVAEGVIAKAPCKVPRLPETQPRRRFLTGEEVRDILAAARPKPDLFEPLVILANVALRPSELWAMKWGDVSLKDATLAVLTKKKGRAGDIRRDVVPLNTDALDALRARADRMHAGKPDPSSLVFGVEPAKRGLLLNGKTRKAPGTLDGAVNLARHRFGRQVKALARKAGVADPGSVVPYSFRHAAATRLLENGAHVREVADLLRHRSPLLTLNTYSHSRPERLRAAVEGLVAAAPVAGDQSKRSA